MARRKRYSEEFKRQALNRVETRHNPGIRKRRSSQPTRMGSA